MKPTLQFGEWLAFDERWRGLVDMMECFAAADGIILLIGETGTGKELVAREIGRRRPPFVAESLASLDATAARSALFGHVEGAYTGALSRRDGLVHHAGRGTLFIDEIGKASLELQSLLLRFLETRTYRPLGSDRVHRSGARLVFATSRNLAVMADEGRFLPDLLGRLTTLHLTLPPLRDRMSELDGFARRFAGRAGIDVDAVCWLHGEAFPGNLRDLSNRISRARALGISRGQLLRRLQSGD